MVVLAVLLVAVVVSSFVTLPYYALVPGSAVPVSQFEAVPAARRTTTEGRILLTDIGLNYVKAINWIPDSLDPNVELVRTQDLTCNVPLDQYNAEGDVDMAESQITAEAVALRQLGYEVPERDAGVTVYVIDPGSPAAGALQVGDVITAVDGTPTTNPAALSAAVDARHPGDTVTLSVARDLRHPDRTKPVTVRLSHIVLDGRTRAFLGVGLPPAQNICGLSAMGTQPQYTLPFPVSITTEDIGGPSAGLAFTLGLINELGGGHLTGGRTVAATGTIRPDGSVGDVGGVALKTVAVTRAGATVFFVPPVEVRTARAHAGPHLAVYGVGSVGQAIAILERLGGTPGTAAGPPAGPGGHSTPADWQQSPWT